MREGCRGGASVTDCNDGVGCECMVMAKRRRSGVGYEGVVMAKRREVAWGASTMPHGHLALSVNGSYYNHYYGR